MTQATCGECRKCLKVGKDGRFATHLEATNSSRCRGSREYPEAQAKRLFGTEADKEEI